MLAFIHGHNLNYGQHGQRTGGKSLGKSYSRRPLILPIIFLPLKKERVSVVSDMQETLAIYGFLRGQPPAHVLPAPVRWG
jgi:hypothetical protein